MKAKQTNKDKIYEYSTFKHFCYLLLSFWCRSYVQLGTETLFQ